MIHNVDSYTSNVAGQEHNLKNCVHKHSGGFLDMDIKLKMDSGKPENLQTEETKLPTFDLFTGGIKKIVGKGIGFLKGIWNEQGDDGQRASTAVTVREGAGNLNGKTNQTGIAAVLTAEAVADIKPPKQTEAIQEPETGKRTGAIPALRVKTGQARERFAAKKDAFLKKMKETAKSRRGFFKDNTQERPGQQEKQTEWFELENIHLLDSYNKNGEYTNLGSDVNIQGYSGNPMRDNYSSKA